MIASSIAITLHQRMVRPAASCGRGSNGRRPATGRWRVDERGQAFGLVAAVLAVAAVVVVAMGSFVGTAVSVARARTAADAAALAGVTGGEPAAVAIAARHGATVVAWSASGPPNARDVRVTVRVGRASATAAASNRASGAVVASGGVGEAAAVPVTVPGTAGAP